MSIIESQCTPNHAPCSMPDGYAVSQTDIHSPTVTVYESLIFSARLRLPAGQTDEKARLQGLCCDVSRALM